MNKALTDKRRTVPGGSEGMTIIELMIVLVIASIFAIAMFRVFETSSKMATRQNVSIDAQEGIRASLNFMAKDLSMAGLSTAAGTPGILVAGETRIQFQADRDLNGVIDTYPYGPGNLPELLEFRLEPAAPTPSYPNRVGELVVVPNADDDTMLVLLDNVTAFSLSYIDANGNRLAVSPALTDPANRAEIARIRSVEISISAEAASTADSTGREFSMLKWIRCRNLGIW